MGQRIPNKQQYGKPRQHSTLNSSNSGWLIKSIAGIFASALRLLFRSWRVTFIDRYHINSAFQNLNHRPVIAVFWHGTYVPLFAALRGINGCVFTSDSFRGRVIQQVCSSFGYTCSVLPRSPQTAIAVMEQAISQYRIVALAADGPLGPYHVVKKSVVELATRTAADILPIAIASHFHIIPRSRWDRFTIPYPFSRVCIVFGEPVDHNIFANNRADCELVYQALQQSSRRADEII